MTTAPPGRLLRCGADACPNPPVPAPRPRAARHTGLMALRFTVQGDTEAETAAGYRLLLSLGLQPLMPPADTIGNGWMARAVPKRKAPTETDGRGPGMSGG